MRGYEYNSFLRYFVMKRVVIGISGGVDSAVAALLLKKQGYEVIGVNFVLHENPDLSDAKKVADFLGIDLIVKDYSKEFKTDVKDYFADEYFNGRTPNPCIVCNRKIKFKKLIEVKNEIGADYIATGHYAKIEKENGIYTLVCADIKKDQTYFLYQLNQEILSVLKLPLSELSKDEIRKIAENENIPVAHKSDSQEICFIPDDDYVNFLKENYKAEVPEGNFIDLDGNILGRHKGIIYYTIGQRKGLGITFGKPVYVIKTDVENNTVTLGENADLFTKKFTASHINFVSGIPAENKFSAEVKIRCRAKKAPAEITVCEDRFIIEFEEPQRAVTPGQAAVFYNGDKVIGGGIID